MNISSIPIYPLPTSHHSSSAPTALHYPFHCSLRVLNETEAFLHTNVARHLLGDIVDLPTIGAESGQTFTESGALTVEELAAAGRARVVAAALELTLRGHGLSDHDDAERQQRCSCWSEHCFLAEMMLFGD